MDFRPCEYSECGELAMCSCKCRENPILFCLEHLPHHFTSEFSLNHSVTNLYAHVTEKEICSLVEAKAEFLKMIDQKTSVLTEKHEAAIAKLNEKFQKEIDKMNFYRDKISDIVENVMSSQMIPKDNKGKLLENMINRQSNEEYDEYKFHYNIMKKLSFLDQNVITDRDGQFLYYFEQNSKTMVQVNNENHKAKRIRIESLPENFGNRSGNCVLDDGSVFYCGGQSNHIMKSCYIINPNNKEWTKLADIPEVNYEITALHHEKHIYVVGGYNNSSNLNSIYRYSLENDKWKKLATIPVASNSCYAIECNEHILFSGYQTSGVYAYSLEKNTVEKVFDGSSNGYCLLLKTGNGKLFALLNKSIYKSSIEDFKNWRNVGTYSVNLDFPDSSPQLHGEYFYFKEFNINCRRFNYKKLHVEEVRLRMKN